MSDSAVIFLRPGKEAAVKRFHPWIFSGAIGKTEGKPREGDQVRVLSARGEFLGIGHWAEGSIAVKLFSFEDVPVDSDFWTRKLRKAWRLREQLGLTGSSYDNGYRLVFSEGDGLPGLIIDYYNGTAVIQAHSRGMFYQKELIVNSLIDIYGDALKSVYDKSDETLKRRDSEPRSTMDNPSDTDPGNPPDNHYLYGSRREGEILETGHRFRVDWEKGQKTGFFLDQRANRMFAQHYAGNRKVLNLFCYSGAFSVYAIKGGATLVHSVDSSRQAIDLVRENYLLNGIDPDQHPCFIADAKKFAGETREKYDMIILDPPAFAKTHTVSNNALHAYIYINAAALRLLNPGGLLFTFSCSQAITRQLFNTALYSAALESGRTIRILHRLSQGPDHPVSIYHPEGEYLKGLILAVE